MCTGLVSCLLLAPICFPGTQLFRGVHSWVIWCAKFTTPETVGLLKIVCSGWILILLHFSWRMHSCFSEGCGLCIASCQRNGIRLRHLDPGVLLKPDCMWRLTTSKPLWAVSRTSTWRFWISLLLGSLLVWLNFLSLWCLRLCDHSVAAHPHSLHSLHTTEMRANATTNWLWQQCGARLSQFEKYLKRNGNLCVQRNKNGLAHVFVILRIVECCWMLLSVVGCCCLLLDVSECCWMLLSVVGCCWLFLVVPECCSLLLDVAECCWMLVSVVECCCWMLQNGPERQTTHLRGCQHCILIWVSCWEQLHQFASWSVSEALENLLW